MPGTAICKLLLSFGAKNIIICDKNGIINKDMENINDSMKELSLITNKENIKGNLKDALVNADVFIGVSAPNLVSKEMALTMNKDAIVFAMANPTPEIFPDVAKEAGIKVIGTGRSDFPNQVNNEKCKIYFLLFYKKLIFFTLYIFNNGAVTTAPLFLAFKNF